MGIEKAKDYIWAQEAKLNARRETLTKELMELDAEVMRLSMIEEKLDAKEDEGGSDG